MPLNTLKYVVICLVFFVRIKSEDNFTEKRIDLPQKEGKIEKVTVKKDEELRIIFTVKSEALGCSFTSPKGRVSE